jgi:glycosyltransferase involved in cell wall biosynthesis
MIHSLIMGNLDRDRFDVHVACNAGPPGKPSASLLALRQVPDLIVRPTDFGPTMNSTGTSEKLRAGLRAPSTFASLAGLVAYARKHKIEVIHGTEKPRDAFYGYLLSRLTGAKSITHLHVKCEDWISPLTKLAMRRGDAMIGVSDFVAKSILAEGYPASKTYHVVNSIDASRWDYNLDREPVRNEFGIAPDTALISIMARLFHWKGHTQLLEALARVRDRSNNFKLLIAGEDDPRTTPGRGSYMAELKALTAQLGLQDRVVFTGFRRDIPQILAATDIYAMPTFEEPCAVAFLEAMAMKKAVIALDSGGTPEMVEHGKSGLLSPVGDIDQLAANILELIADPAKRREMGEYGRMRVETYHTPRRLADEVAQVYDRLLTGRVAQLSAVRR